MPSPLEHCTKGKGKEGGKTMDTPDQKKNIPETSTVYCLLHSTEYLLTYGCTLVVG